MNFAFTHALMHSPAHPPAHPPTHSLIDTFLFDLSRHRETRRAENSACDRAHVDSKRLAHALPLLRAPVAACSGAD
jgi:hypothetical protein